MNYEDILSHFQIVRRYGDKAQCRCPCHDDKQASLTITRGKRCILLHCHAGCRFEDVIQAVGLKKQDLFYEGKFPNSDWQAYVERRERKKIEAIYNYTFLNGRYAFTKVRMQGKKIIYGMLANERFTYGLGGRTRKELCAVYAPGGVQAISKAISEGRPVFIPEGCKDVDALVKRGYISYTYGGASDWTAEMAQLCKGAIVYVLADNDESGQRVANTIQSDLQGIAESAKVIVPVPDIPKADISDFFAAGHSREEFEQLLKEEVVTKKCMQAPGTIEAQNLGLPQDKVRTLLAYKTDFDKDGNVKGKKVLQTVRNFEIIMENDQRFAGKIRFDEFSQQIYLVGNILWVSLKDNCRAWSSYDDSALFSILQSDYGMNSRNDYFDAIKNVSTHNKFHPIRELLDSLSWDGGEHIRSLLPDYLGAENSEYQYQSLRLWMLGAVSRIYSPGCKFDYTLIFTGPQGIGKSTFLRMMALNDSWFNDSLDGLDSDKAAQSLMGSWIIELAELKSLARTVGGVDSVKRFLTATADKYRIPYERRADTFLRQCVFAGTTNRSDFLSDETGNRRFLIIEVGINKPKKSLFKPEAISDFQAAWAEAVHIFKTENPQLILPDSCQKEATLLQERSMADDGKVGLIQEYLADKQRTCVIEIWNEALDESGRPLKWQASEINNILSSLKDWERMRNPAKFGKYGSQRGFQKRSLQTQGSSTTNDGTSQDFMEIPDSELSELPFC